MQKKKWFIGTIAAAAVVVCGAIGIGSVKSVDADAAEGKSAQEEFIYEQLGRDDYTGIKSGSARVVLATSDEKYYAVIDKNGDVYSIDNSDEKYGKIAISSSAYLDSTIMSEKDGKLGILDMEGNVLLDGNYHSKIQTVYKNDLKYIAAIDDNKAVIYNENDNSELMKIDLEKNIYSTGIVQGYLCINYSVLYDMSGNNVTDKLKKDNMEISHISYLGDKYLAVYYIASDNVRHTFYYDTDLKAVSDDDVQKYKDYLSTNSVSASNVTSAKTFNYIGKSAGEFEKTEDGYMLSYVGVLKGYKAYLGYKTVKDENKNSVYYAIFDENKNMLIQNVAGYSYCIGDKVVLSEKNSEGTSVYKVIKVSLKSESGIADIVKNEDGSLEAEVSAKDIDKDDIKDSDGNTVKYDDLDEDAKAVIEQKFDFKIKADKDVIPEDSHMSISKVVAGKEYDAAKQVTQAVVNRIAIFNIDLLSKDNVKIQPNGKLEITADIPNGYNTAYIAVYRLSEDGKSYTKLNSKVVDGKIIFETDHFSTYMIVEEIAEAAVEAEAPDSGDSNNIFVLIAIMMLAVLTGVVAFERKRA